MAGSGRYPPIREEMAPKRRSSRDVLDVDQELLERVMTAVIKIERDVRRLESNQEVQAVDLQSVSKHTQDLTMIKKIAVAIVSMLLPYLMAAIPNAIKSYERLDRLEKNVEQYNDRSAQTNLDIQSLRQQSERTAISHEDLKAKEKQIEELSQELERLRKNRRY